MKKITILLLCLSPAFSGAAQQMPDTLLLKYRAMALDYNDDVKAAAKNITASIELEKTAAADRGPKLAAGGEFQYTGNPLELSLNLPGAGSATFRGQDIKYAFSATLLQPVYTGGRILESIRMARTQQSMAVSQDRQVRSLVCFQTDVQYWNTVARREMCDIAADFRNSVASLTQIIRERVEAGLADRQDLLTAEVKLNEAEYLLLQAESDFETGRMALNALIGAPLDAPTEIGGNVTQVDRATRTPVGTPDARPEVQLAQKRIELEKSMLRLNDARFKPQVYVGANGGYYAPGYNFRPDLSPNYALYAQVSIPVFEWGKRRSGKRASEQHIGMAEDNLHQVKTGVELEARTAEVALTQAMQRVELASGSLGKARENERRATEKYEEGMISVSEVIDAQVYRQTAQTNYLEARTAARLHYSELLKALNGYNLR